MYATTVTVPSEFAEAVDFALGLQGSVGTELSDFRKNDETDVRVTGYFDSLPDKEALSREIEMALFFFDLPENTKFSVSLSEIANTDWLAEWKKHWKPTTIGSFVIAAPWHEVDENEKIVLRIEPNMAFGTGTHETTQLCLKAIDEFYEPGDSFLDVGTGTGILAIAAALKGGNTSSSECARLGVDTDSDAIKIAKENACLNGVSSKIEFHDRAIDESIPAFDFVCANLTLDVIVPILPLLLSKAKKHLVLSGILESQNENIRLELENLEVSNFEIETAGEWIAVILHR